MKPDNFVWTSWTDLIQSNSKIHSWNEKKNFMVFAVIIQSCVIVTDNCLRPVL